MVDFVEICNVCVKTVIIKAAKRIINFDKMCLSYSDLNFGVTFLEHSVDSVLFFERRNDVIKSQLCALRLNS